jgi:hypothetical protein
VLRSPRRPGPRLDKGRARFRDRQDGNRELSPFPRAGKPVTASPLSRLTSSLDTIVAIVYGTRGPSRLRISLVFLLFPIAAVPDLDLVASRTACDRNDLPQYIVSGSLLAPGGAVNQIGRSPALDHFILLIRRDSIWFPGRPVYACWIPRMRLTRLA